MPEEVKVKLHKNTIMVTNRLRRKQLKIRTPEPSKSKSEPKATIP